MRKKAKNNIGRTSVALLVGALMSSTLITPAIAQDLTGDIRFSWWGSTTRNAKAEQIVSMFEEEYPGVSVSPEPGEWGSYWDKLTVQSASGNQPCAITMQSRWLAQYSDPAILTPLDDLVESGAINTAGIAPAVLDGGRGADGNLYFIPHGVFFFTVYMNKTVIEEAGLEMPGEGWTWDSMAEFARELATHLPDGSYAIGNGGTGMDVFTNWVQGRGEALFNADGSVGFTKETVQGFFDYWEALRQDGITEAADQMSELPDNVIDDTLLANGRIMIDFRPANQVDAHQRVLDVAASGQELTMLGYPAGPAGYGDDLGANGLAIGANCDGSDKDSAVAFINFFTQDPEAAAVYASDNGVVSVDALREAQLQDPATSDGQLQAVNMLGVVGPRARTAFFPAGGYAAVSSTLMSTYEAVAFGQMSTEDAAERLISQVTRLVR